MKIVSFSDITKYSYAITEISVIRQTNRWSFLSSGKGRIFNGFLLVNSGECDYNWNGGAQVFSHGDLLYLPTGSVHTARVPEHTFDFYRINYRLIDLYDREEIVCSDGPMLISKDTPKRIYELTEDMRKTTLLSGTELKNTSMLCEILDYVLGVQSAAASSRIDAAMKYINDHYTEEIDISYLAAMSFISESHLFRLFKSEIGMTPVEYKNSLRMKRAKKLLCDPECGISEIAEMLGFENACYFTRLFKRNVGMSPIKYRQGLMKPTSSLNTK